MDNSVDQLSQKCEACRPLLASQPQQPVKPCSKATHPMSDVGTDLFSIGHNNYIVCVDRFSGWPMCAKLNSTTARAVIKVLYEWYTTWGWPCRQLSDNGPQYNCEEMASFCDEWNVVQEFSSPGYPRHNGLSEIAVKQVKYLLIKCNEDFHEFQSCLQEWRNTPTHTGYAPTQLFLCRRMRGKLPVLPELCLIDAEKATIGAEERKKAHIKLCEEQGGRELKPLLPGQRVLVQQLRGVGKKP